jgi:hypothetical protein
MEFPRSDLKPPYYAVIFTSTRSPREDDGYHETAAAMDELVHKQPGFLGTESMSSVGKGHGASAINPSLMVVARF